MPPVSGQKKLTEAVFTSIREGNYAVDQDVAGTELSSTALQSLSILLEQARVDVKNSISELSRLTATDIDGWISQAKQLRQDINQSEQQSQQIVVFAESGQELQDNVQDASAKAKLLETEVSFNNVVVDTLKEVQKVKQLAEVTRAKLRDRELLGAAKSLVEAETQARGLKGANGTRLAIVVAEQLQKLRSAISEAVEEDWHQLVTFDDDKHTLKIYKEKKSANSATTDQSDKAGVHTPATLEELSQMLSVLELLQERTSAFVQSLDQIICQPLMTGLANSNYHVTVTKDTLALVRYDQPATTETILQGLTAVQDFCKENLPSIIFAPLTQKLSIVVTDRLLSTTLSAVVPVDLGGIPVYDQIIEQVRKFARSTHTSRGSRQGLLRWAEDAPKLWLAKRTESSLNSIRQILKRGLGGPREVERVETRIVKTDDQAFTASGTQNDWDESWSDDEKVNNTTADPSNEHPASQKNGTTADAEDEDVSGWGFDEDEEEAPAQQPVIQPLTVAETNDDDKDQDEGDAWGWGDGDEAEIVGDATATEPKQKHPTADDSHPPRTPRRSSKPAEREVTLRETYHITSLPDQILDIIVMTIEDADTLSDSSTQSSINLSAKGLYLLPSYQLSMFRAAAPSIYATDINGSMFLYNDSQRLVGELCKYIKHHSERHTGSTALYGLSQGDIPVLESFGKRAYGKDMESKRTTLVDLLDGAQGFSNCTQEPFASQCDLAVSSVIDYLRQIHGQWSRVLSRSALLQSTGSLLTTITNKMIIDIEDMSDISEPESQRLVSLCKSITSLEDLFLPEPDADLPQDEQSVPLTAVYTKTWLRFQYLSNILESSLADIKYLWMEGELSIEFTTDEVVDLIEALFADSDHRRRAIAEIRKTR